MEKKEIFSKTAEYLVQKQNKQGHWTERKIKHKESPVYYKDLFNTSQVTYTLAMLSEKNTSPSILKGIFYCKEQELEEHDDLELWAAKLLALNLSNINQKECEKIANLIWKKQKNGSWPKYEFSLILTNYKIINSISGQLNEILSKKSIKWFKKNMSKTRDGWGSTPKASKSFPTFTSNGVLALALLKEDMSSNYLVKSKKFIEKNQKKDGSWCSSDSSVAKPTIYATAVSTLALMILSKNPFNQKVKDGINYLLKNCCKSGGWPLIKGENPETYTTYYALQTILFQEYLEENLENFKNELKDYMNEIQINAFLFRKFINEEILKKVKKTILNDIFDSKAIAATDKAIKRRREILKIISKKPNDVAGIIDELNKKGYSLSKKSHMTQVKFDVEHLRTMKIIDKIRNDYFMVVDPGLGIIEDY